MACHFGINGVSPCKVENLGNAEKFVLELKIVVSILDAQQNNNFLGAKNQVRRLVGGVVVPMASSSKQDT
jgi:hypothetical protein